VRRRVAEAEHQEEGPDAAAAAVRWRRMQTRMSRGGPAQRAPLAAAESELRVLLWRSSASRAPLAGRVAPGRVAWSSPLAAAESASPEESLARLAALAGGDPPPPPRRRSKCEEQVRRTTVR